MPDKILNRFESYQSGGSIGGGGESSSSNIHDDNINIGVGGVGRRKAPSSDNENSNAAATDPPLLSQFSLIGDANDGGEEAPIEHATGIHRRPCLHWYYSMMYHQRFRFRIATSLCLCIIILTGAIVRTDVRKHHNQSPISSEQMTCPIQSSYSVLSEIMKLKNVSTVENKQNGAVSTDDPICSQVGLSILKEGGNAADAAIASTLCLGVTNPSSSGLGGGGFILVHSDARDPSNGEHDGSMPPFEDARAHQSKFIHRRTVAEVASKRLPDDTKLHPSSQRRKVTEFVDCRETAPRNSSYDMFESLPPEASTLGGLAIGVPGELRGLELLHHRHGSMPWENLVRPAMELARDGFVVGPYLAGVMKEKEEYVRSMPNLGHILTKNNDGVTVLKEGDLMIQMQYAKTLEAIMHRGADALYQGDLAKMLAKDIQDAGGIIESSDITNYLPVLRDPLISRVGSYNVAAAPPPSSGGGAIIGVLRFLSGFTTPYSARLDSLSQHWFVEACRHVFAIRMSLSDPKFDQETNANAVKDLIDGEYMEMLRNMTLDDASLKLSQYGGQRWAQLKDTEGGGDLLDAQEGDRRKAMASRNMRLFGYLEDAGTTSLSVVDKDQNTVTITSSVNLKFGSKVVSPSTGIVLNNQMDDFSTPGRANYFGLRPSESNYIMPGKRPLSSMSPTMLFFQENNANGPQKAATDSLGKLVLSVGASGGPKIITSILQTILNHAFVGMPLYESISAPRIHNQLLYHGAAGTNVEQSTLAQGPTIELASRTRMALEKRGHNLIPTDYLGTVQAVAVDLETNLMTAVADIRKQGMPAGY